MSDRRPDSGRQESSLQGIAEQRAQEAPELSKRELDELVDRATFGKPLETSPPVAAAAFLHLHEYSLRTRLSSRVPRLQLSDHPGSKRLLLAATADATRRHEAADRIDEARAQLREEIDAPMETEAARRTRDPTCRELRRAMDMCALRFDGYAYRDAHPEFRAAPVEKERNDEYDAYTLEEKLASMFLMQRYLRKWGGSRTPEHGASRRRYRELFIDLYDKPAPRQWEWETSRAWRWGVEPIAQPYVEAARRQLAEIDYE